MALAVHNTMSSQFSKDGKYFALLSTDNKLKIWETSTSTFTQEYIPDFHLTSPCSCLQFVERGVDLNKSHTPRKKKRRDSIEPTTWIALGTSAGLLLMYSINKGDLDFKIDSETKQGINCITWDGNNCLFTGIDQEVYCWNLLERFIKSKWKAGNEKINSMLSVPKDCIVTASRDIKLWNAKSQQLLKTFTGHSHDVSLLYYVPPPSDQADPYVMSGSKNNRFLSVWNLNEKLKERTAVANFFCNDVPRSLTVVTEDGLSNLVVVTSNGILHFYQHTLNGKCLKPIKPQRTLQIATETPKKNSKKVVPIPIHGATLNNDSSILIGHGSELVLTFENVVLRESKVQCLIRKDPHIKEVTKEVKVTNVRTPVVDNEVHYITPNTSKVATAKRKNDTTGEIPMQKRLENLTLNKLDSSDSLHKVNNVAHLLAQGLHSKDKTILRSVFSKHDEEVIKNTIKRLPMPVIIPFVQEVTDLIQGKTAGSECGTRWLKHFLHIHAGLLLCNPELPEILGPLLSTIENRTALLQPFNRLKGRLDLLLSQRSSAVSNKPQEEDHQVLICNDRVAGENDVDDMEVIPHSDSENEWMEEEEVSGDENEKPVNGDALSDDDDDDDDDMMS